MFCGRELRQFILKVDSEIKKQNSAFNKVSMRINQMVLFKPPCELEYLIFMPCGIYSISSIELYN